MRTRDRRRQMKTLAALYSKMNGVLGHLTEWPKYLDQNRKEEIGHRRFCPDGVRCGLSLGQAVKLFAVRQILAYRAGEDAPDPATFFEVRTAIFMAWALYARNLLAIQREFTGTDAEEACRLDYAELNKDPIHDTEE